jgi:hypothetical protein
LRTASTAMGDSSDEYCDTTLEERELGGGGGCVGGVGWLVGCRDVCCTRKVWSQPQPQPLSSLVADGMHRSAPNHLIDPRVGGAHEGLLVGQVHGGGDGLEDLCGGGSFGGWQLAIGWWLVGGSRLVVAGNRLHAGGSICARHELSTPTPSHQPRTHYSHAPITHKHPPPPRWPWSPPC